ncbi:transcriptional regulator with XRE-family HTH domain [Saccharopolyspora lacisalsi]|uniref:Transcriptional regulator with XRE-family HTH domain n=1 Tax=Halosaccharopolyspora lacisalsi TaxID=1000566 RepID=A0A839DRW8_9PSEU|nr:XRE family transcriptional regulator [Halosaccharopolyspora lacisalsi]MBA8823479.1 transcriptional regulator with XRE-family HTH domain [Halosaccharopolyspora lacisalsi]
MSHTDPTPLEIISVALRRERDRAGISLSELAKRAGVAKSTLSQLESGSGNPSVETLWALAVALGIPFTRLVESPTPHVRVIRSGQAAFVRSERSPFAAALLSSCPAGARRDLYTMALDPGTPRHAAAHISGTVEHVLVTAGRMRAGPEEDPVEVEPGDYVSFSGDVAHCYEALESGTTAVLVMEHT